MTLPVRVPVKATVNTTGSPSLAAAFAIDRVGVLPPPSSSSLMVPEAVPSWMVAPPGLLRLTVKDSVCSSMSSSTVGTEIVLELSLAAKVSDREVCV